MNFEPQCKTQSDLYREMSRVHKMCEGTDARPETGWKFNGHIQCRSPAFSCPLECYEFSIGIVEGKHHVFRGDTLYTKSRDDLPFGGLQCIKTNGDILGVLPEYWTLNPPEQEPIIPEGFTKWEGGEWTGHPLDTVEVHFRYGINKKTHLAMELVWKHMCKDYDIIAYKIVKEYQPETVMVELPIKLVQWRASDTLITAEELAHLRDMEHEACRKALIALK